VLVVNDQEWSARSLESILMPNGYAVLRAFTGANGLERARLHTPDVVIVAQSLPDTDGLTLCRALHDQRALSDRVPVLLHLPERPTRTERLTALRAGAWDVLAPPIDAEELILRLESYVRAKVDGDRAQETGLVDAATHFYNASGLEFRAAELAAWAQRHAEPLSCVVLGFARASTGDDAKVARAVDRMTDVLRRSGRTSDVIGRTGPTEFAVLAPGTNQTAAVQLAERLATALRSALSSPQDGYPTVELRGGYDTVADARDTPLKGPELITRATLAFSRAKVAQNGGWLRPFGSPSAPM
jgi:diguanylate cyclase (GGDEF)-like protein